MNGRQMIGAGAVLTVLFFAGCSVFEAVLPQDLPDNIEMAKETYSGMDLKGTERVLRGILAAPKVQPKSRAEGLIMQAKIAWKFHKDSEQAKDLLRQTEDLQVEDTEYEILALLSRVERESSEFQKALATASRAIKRAASEEQWAEARTHWAQVIWEQSLARVEKNQPFDRALVDQGVATLREVLRKVPGYPAPSRILLGLALLARDNNAAFVAWKSYFNIADDGSPRGILAGPHELLRSVLPNWQDRAPSRQEGLR